MRWSRGGDPAAPSDGRLIRGMGRGAVAALAAGFALGGCGSGASSDCSALVAGLEAGSKVVDYQEPLADACQDYATFVDAYDAIPAGEGPGLAPGFVLVFCAPFSEPDVPSSVFDSALCQSARADDPNLPNLSDAPASDEGPSCYHSPFDTNPADNCSTGSLGESDSDLETSELALDGGSPPADAEAAEAAVVTEVPNAADAKIASTDYRADLTVNADADQMREGFHLVVRKLKLRQSTDGSFTAAATVYNPQDVAIQAVLILAILDGGSEVTSYFADGPCVPPGESRAMSWDDSLQGDVGASYDDVAFYDSASKIGC